MEEDCLFFPEMYRLHDLAEETGTPLADMDLASLVDLCTLCGLCPCQDIRMLVLKAKAARAEENPPPLSARLLSDAQQAGRWGTAFSAVLNPLNRLKPVTAIAKKILDIHPERSLPAFPEESFFVWAKKKGIDHACEKPQPGCLESRLFCRMQCRVSVSWGGQSSGGPAGTKRNSGVCPFPALLQHAPDHGRKPAGS
jgi:glycerol-3-phosphate dehydrogenase subunit C